MAKDKFYAVKVGHKTGVFTSWTKFNEAVKGHPAPFFCFFYSLEEANAFMNSETIGRVPASSGKTRSRKNN